MTNVIFLLIVGVQDSKYIWSKTWSYLLCPVYLYYKNLNRINALSIIYLYIYMDKD